MGTREGGGYPPPLRFLKTKDMVKIRSKFCISGDTVISKGQIIDLPKEQANYWVIQGYGEFVEEDKTDITLAKVIPPPEKNPEAEVFELATEKTKTEKATTTRVKTALKSLKKSKEKNKR